MKTSFWLSAGLLGAGSLWAWFLLSLPPPVACELKPKGACKPIQAIAIEQNLDMGAVAVAACREGYAHSCLAAGDDHAFGKYGRKKSLLEAEAFYERACSLGHEESCLRIGERFFKGMVVDINYARAEAYFSRACEMKSAEGCARLGLIFLMKENVGKAREHFTDACTMGSAGACEDLAGVVKREGGSDAAAKALLDRACGLGDWNICEKIAGKKLSHDEVQEMVCERSQSGDPCFDLAEMHIQKEGVEGFRRLALLYYEKACLKNYYGSKYACARAGNIELENKNLARARAFFDSACEKKDDRSCERLQRLPASNR